MELESLMKVLLQKQRLDKKMKDDEIDKKLQELKAKKGK